MKILNVTIKTYLQNIYWSEEVDPEIEKEDEWINVNKPYCKEVYRRLYKSISGFIYGGISFVINGEESTGILSSFDLHGTWSTLLDYYLYGDKNKKTQIYMESSTHYLVNNQDKNNPQVRLEYYRKYTEWMPVPIMKQAILDAFLEFMQIIEHDVIHDIYDEDGDPFEFPEELSYLLKCYESLS